MRLLPTLLLSAVACLHAEVKVMVGDVVDRRTTGKSHHSLEVRLKIAGPELAGCKGMRFFLKDATDDTGKLLEREDSFFDEDEFQPPEKPFESSGREGGGDYEFTLEFDNPARAAKSIKSINGSIEVLLPEKDPASVITASFAKHAGRPLADDTLKAAGIELTLLGARDSEVRYTVSDPKSKLAALEFCSTNAKPLKTESKLTSESEGGLKSIHITLENPAAPDTVAKIYLLTEKSVLTVPIALTGIPLP